MKSLAVAAVLLAAVIGTVVTFTDAGDGADAQAAERSRSPKLLVTSRGLTDRATLTSTCGVARNGGGFCEEVVDPKVRGRLPVRSRGRLRLRSRPAARRLIVQLARVRQGEVEHTSGTRRARPEKGTNGRRWRFRLPADLGAGNALDVIVRYRRQAREGGSRISQASFISRVDKRDCGC